MLLNSKCTWEEKVGMWSTTYNLAWRVVKHLIAPIEDRFHNLYMDNFYCDRHIFLELENQETACLWNHKGNSKGERIL